MTLYMIYIGLPSAPVLSIDVNPSSITITVQSQYPGVPATDNSFSFTVIVLDEQNSTVYNMTFDGTSDRVITIDVPVGMYVVRIFSENSYGVSVESSSIANVIMEASVSPTVEEEKGVIFDTTNIYNYLSHFLSPLEFPLYAIIGIGVGGTVLIFAIFIITVIIALCFNRKYKTRGS